MSIIPLKFFHKIVAKNGKGQFYTYNSFHILQLKSLSTILLFWYVVIDYRSFQFMQAKTYSIFPNQRKLKKLNIKLHSLLSLYTRIGFKSYDY